jgi:branched-chain amino acid aminotransferase
MNIDWDKLGFNYLPVNTHIRYSYKDGRWNEGKSCKDHTINLSVAAACLHYGQEAFEGLKAFRCKDGKIKVFRPDQNAARLNKTITYILCPEVPEEIFIEAVKRVINDNIEFVPPYGTGGAFYIRPLMIGSSPQIGIAPSRDYEFIVLAIPVGAYYKGGLKPLDALLIDDIDRAAPLGTGHIKVGGNYAASLISFKKAKEHDCQIALFLDAKHRQYIEEFGTSNFIGITKDGKYVTPDSPSILNSITNKSLMQIAKDEGITVEKRQISKDELEDFVEVGACGTAVVITPVRRIIYGDRIFNYGSECPILKKLYLKMTGIQYGEEPDNHGWMMEI